MKKIFEFIKLRYAVILTTITVYQIFLCIFFFSSTNFYLLSLIMIIIAAGIIYDKYKEPIYSKIKKILKK